MKASTEPHVDPQAETFCEKKGRGSNELIPSHHTSTFPFHLLESDKIPRPQATRITIAPQTDAYQMSPLLSKGAPIIPKTAN
uniref:Uncharacterized protein n=1 Tax=Arundo donax TaxID=35708 RepID=A0A0A9C682_ARUDO